MDAETAEIEHPASEFIPVHIAFLIRSKYSAVRKLMQQ
jgi:hypothetical protein